ncbi:MAG: hypothetical protein WCS72_18035, partial [Deltaproteobacteria bacterium]
RMKDGSIRPKEGVGLAQFYEGVMRGYTYLAGMGAERTAAVEPPTAAPSPAEPVPAPPLPGTPTA